MSRVRVPILMYHEVTPHPHPAFRKYTLTPTELERQLAWLAHGGFAVVGLDAVLAAYRDGTALPRRAVAITFDDGLRDSVLHATPVLQRHGYTATFFVVAGLVGTTSRWLRRERGLELPMADWDMLREAEAAGMRCEGHSLSHPRLAELDRTACRMELTTSRTLLEAHLGHPVRRLAYPFGSYSAATRALAAEAGYELAVTVREAIAGPGDDPLALPRIPVVGGESLLDFVSRLRTGHPVSRLPHAAVAAVRRRMGLGPASAAGTS